MRLTRLDLLRYGHLSDVALEFPEDAALHVVHGANEAGKSTALAAIADALFGFGHRTDFDFLHGAPHLRIGFAVLARDGTRGKFVRRKGRRDTLRDAADAIVSEDALARFLGGASRELFERSFGLGGARLRAGAQELLRSGGDAGESLLAGAGLLNLRTALNALDDEAKSLVGDGRGKRRLSEAVDTWRMAQRAIDERAVAPRAWQEADAAHTEADAELASVQAAIRALTIEDSRLQRVRRVAPRLAELDAAHAALALVADAPQLPSDTESVRQHAIAARRDAKRDVERETADATRLAEALAALSHDAAALAMQEAIDALAARRSVVLQAAEDVPKVRGKIAAHRTKAADALEDLGVSLAPEAARDGVPPVSVRRAVQRLISQRAALAATASAAGQGLAAAQRRRDQAAAKLLATPAPPSPEMLRRTIDEMRGEGPLDTELERAARTLADAERAADAALATLPLWRGDMDRLRACRLPLPADMSGGAARLDAAADALADERDASVRLLAEIATLEAEISRLGRGETVATPDIVTSARSARDRVWRLLRRMYEGGPDPDAAELVGLPSGPLPDAFETLRDRADHLADKRADDAQRVADFLTATARLDLLLRRRAGSDAALAAAQGAVSDAAAAWRELWAPAGLIPEGPMAMTEWRRCRDDVLRLAETASQARGRHDDVAARRGRAMTALAALLSAEEHDTLAALLLRAETACNAAEAAVAAFRARAEALAREEAHLPELQDASNAATVALAAWQHGWASAVTALGLTEDASIETAEAALDAWRRIAEVAPAWREDDQRVADMAASVDRFAADVRGVLAGLAELASDEPTPVTAARLARRLSDARKAADDATELTGRIASHETSAADAGRRLRAAEEVLATLRALAGAADDVELEHAIERARQRDAAAGDITRIRAAISAQGDGRTEDALRAEVAGVDADVVVARIDEIARELITLGERRESLSAERTRTEARLAEMRNGWDAAAKAQEAEDALADALAAADRYARLHVARTLLRFGIDRFRSEQQGPMLRAAGAHFALLTGGRYVRLGVGEDSAGRAVLLAIRDDGVTECPVEALSEGARDQLYLSLRAAAIESHAAKAEPLPFIADDLLVNFDDARAAAGVALLARLGQTSQVILFTHHDHIAALAAGQAGVAVQRMPALISADNVRVTATAAG
jgi:chromosome segregation protein